MYKYLTAAAFAAFLVACNSGKNETRSERQAEAKGPCYDIERIEKARADAIPFESLRGEPVMLGERPLDDMWTSADEHFGTSCKLSVMSGFFGGESDFHSIGCELDQKNGSLDMETRQAEASAILEETREKLQTCLGDGWEMSISDDAPDADIYKKYKF